MIISINSDFHGISNHMICHLLPTTQIRERDPPREYLSIGKLEATMSFATMLTTNNPKVLKWKLKM